MAKPITTIALRGDRDTIAWLKKAAGGDYHRPVLDCLSRQGSFVVTTDGFRAHFAETPECIRELEETNEHGQANYRICESAISWEGEKNEYPSISDHVKVLLPDGEPLATFHISPRFLIEALEGFVNDTVGVLIAVYSEDTITVQSLEGDKRYAVIKGIVRSLGAGEEHLWRPEIPQVEEG